MGAKPVFDDPVALVLLIFALAVCGFATAIIVGAYRAFRRRRHAITLVLVLLAMLLLGTLALVFLLVMPGGDGVVARAVTANGIELCIAQEHTGYLGEPYYVSLYIRKPKQNWEWFYVDHEDVRWFRSHIDVDEITGTALVKRNGRTPWLTYDLNTGVRRFLQTDRRDWAPGEPMPAGWEPGMKRRGN